MKTKLAAIVAMAEAFQAKGSIYPDSYPDWAQLRQALDEAHVAAEGQHIDLAPPVDDAELERQLGRIEALANNPAAINRLAAALDRLGGAVAMRSRLSFPSLAV